MISDVITKHKISVKHKIIDPITEEKTIIDIEEDEYILKIINKTKYDIEDISFELLLMEDYLHGNGKNFTSKSIGFKGTSNLNLMVGRKNKNEIIHDNCRQIRIKGNLEELWDKKTEWLLFQITSYHSRSGSRKTHTHRFNTPSVTIKEGMFDSGETFDLIDC